MRFSSASLSATDIALHNSKVHPAEFGVTTQPTHLVISGASISGKRHESVMIIAIDVLSLALVLCVWIKSITQSITNERDSEYNDGEYDDRQEDVPGMSLQQVGSICNHQTKT